MSRPNYSAMIPASSDIPKLEEKHFQSVQSHELKNMNYYIDQLGTGIYTYKTLAILGSSFFVVGAVLLAFGLADVVLGNQLGLSESESMFLGSQAFLGNAIGAILGGMFCDKNGRRKTYFLACCSLLVFSLLSVISTSFFWLVVTQLLAGVACGALTVMLAVQVIEISPSHCRGQYSVMVSTMFSFGEMYTCLIASLTITYNDPREWKYMVVWATIPIILPLICAYSYLKESPRYAILHNVSGGIEVLGFISRENNKLELMLSQQEVNELSVWVLRQQQRPELNKSNIEYLFFEDNFELTVKLMLVWSCLFFSYFGSIFIWPYVVEQISPRQDNTLDVGAIAFSIAGEIPAIVLGYFTVETELFGRKFSLWLSCGVGAILCFLEYTCRGSLYMIFIFFVKFILNTGTAYLVVYTSEAYHTKYRATGFGLGNAVGLFAGMIVPFVALPSFESSTFSPFIIFGVVVAVAAVSANLLSFETRGKQLDHVKEDGMKSLNYEMVMYKQ